MKGWQIGLVVLVAVTLLLFWPVLVRAQEQLLLWPANVISPKLHYDCKSATGTIYIRVELAGRVTNDYVVECNGV